MAKLVGIAGLTAGREYPLGELCLIGRSQGVHIRLPDLAVSRQHAKITRVGESYVIEDLASGAGIQVNRRAVSSSPLRSNDEITIAGFSFRFVETPNRRAPTGEISIETDEEAARILRVDTLSAGISSRALDERPSSSEAQRLSRQLDAILAVGRAASSSLDPAAMLNEILKSCLGVYPTAERALVAVQDRERRELVVKAMVMREKAPSTEPRLALPRSVVSEVLYMGRAVVGERTATGGHMMVAPLICHGQMLGLIHVDRTRPGAPFVEEDLSVLTGIATETALALYNAELVQKLLKQSRIEQELGAAHEVQKRFLPRGVPKLAGFTFVAHYDPCRDVGGDLYDFIPLDASRVGILVGDVSGKGLAAALVMAWVTSQIRVVAQRERAPADVLARINELFVETGQDDLFVTAFYGVLDRWTMSIHFANAGHVPPLVRRRSGVVESIESGTALPVGMLAGAAFEEGRISLGRGDTFLLVTDGVTEAQNAAGRMFGLDGLTAAAHRSHPAAPDLVGDILAELRSFSGNREKSDDITLVAVGVDEVQEDAWATILPEEFSGGI